MNNLSKKLGEIINRSDTEMTSFILEISKEFSDKATILQSIIKEQSQFELLNTVADKFMENLILSLMYSCFEPNLSRSPSMEIFTIKINKVCDTLNLDCKKIRPLGPLAELLLAELSD